MVNHLNRPRITRELLAVTNVITDNTTFSGTKIGLLHSYPLVPFRRNIQH
jgi:hypothetical protein